MKKLLALLTALIMALSCTLALAEANEPFRMNIDSTLTVNHDMAMELMETFGLEDSALAMGESIVNILSNLGGHTVMDDTGIQWDLLLNGTVLATLAGEVNDEGLALGTNLMPGTVLTLSGDSIVKVLEQAKAAEEASREKEFVPSEALVNAVKGYLDEFIEDAMAGVEIGESEQVEYDLGDGITFNTHTPINVDAPTIAEAMKNFVEKMIKDENFQAALKSAGNVGAPVDEVNFDTEPFEDMLVVCDLYTNVNENGEGQDPTCWQMVISKLDDNDEETAYDDDGEDKSVYVNVLVNEGAYEMDITQGANTYTCSFVPDVDSVNLYIGGTVNGLYGGMNVNMEFSEEGIVGQSDVYFLNEEEPLLTEKDVLTFGEGERTLSLDTEGKKVVALEELSNDSEGKTTRSLMSDLMRGLMGLAATAAEAMPDEVGALMSAMSGDSMEDVG